MHKIGEVRGKVKLHFDDLFNSLSNNCTKNYYNRTLTVQVVIEDVVTWIFLRHSSCFMCLPTYTCHNDVGLHSPIKRGYTRSICLAAIDWTGLRYAGSLFFQTDLYTVNTRRCSHVSSPADDQFLAIIFSSLSIHTFGDLHTLPHFYAPPIG